MSFKSQNWIQIIQPFQIYFSICGIIPFTWLFHKIHIKKIFIDKFIYLVQNILTIIGIFLILCVKYNHFHLFYIENKVSNIMFHIQFILWCIIHLIILCESYFKYKNLINFFHKLQLLYDKVFLKYFQLVIGRKKIILIKNYYIIIFIVIVCILLILTLYLHFKMYSLYTIVALWAIPSEIVVKAKIFQFYIMIQILNEISNNINLISIHLIEKLEKFHLNNYEEKLIILKEVQYLQEIHIEIYELSKIIDDYFSVSMLIIFVFNLFLITNNLYWMYVDCSDGVDSIVIISKFLNNLNNFF